MDKSKITIAIATFNSSKILEQVLSSINQQTYSKELIEILLIDGGSTDSTFEIAKKYNCEVINNPQTEPVNAKFIAYKECKSEYLMFLDHDEVLFNKNSLEIKINLFKSNSNIKAIASTGYKNPNNYPFINNYINEFGDPFSCFIYNLSKSYQFFIKKMRSKYKNYKENEFGLCFDFKHEKILPIIEICAGGGIMDIKYFKNNIAFTLDKKEHIPHFFYYMVENNGLLGITKNDYLLHYSSDTLKRYFNKIKWRIKNNIFHIKDMGQSGFSGRNKFQKNTLIKHKKFLFIPYSLLILPCFVDSVRLCITRKDIRYLIHVPLCIYTSIIILYYYLLKIFGFKEDLRSYDNYKKI